MDIEWAQPDYAVAIIWGRCPNGGAGQGSRNQAHDPSPERPPSNRGCYNGGGCYSGTGVEPQAFKLLPMVLAMLRSLARAHLPIVHSGDLV